MLRHVVKVCVVMVLIERLQLGNHVLVHRQVIDGLVHVGHGVDRNDFKTLPVELRQPNERRDNVQRPGRIRKQKVLIKSAD